MSFDPVTFLFLIPALAAVVIALMPGSKLSAYVNAGASFLTFLAGLSLLWVERPAPGAYVLVDEFNTIFVVLITFVSFTTSVFSATYVEYELETGRVTPAFLKLYHALYQALTLCFVLALLSNNIGVMWVAIELATLTTVVMVGIYRTHAAIEAAWKYFILASVGIALALFGTILVYMAAEPVMGAGLNAMVWTDLVARAASLEPAMLNLAFVFLLLGYGTKIGLVPAPCLAARRACRRSDADHCGALRPAAQRRALRAAPLQDAARRQPGGAGARAADDRHGARLAPVRRLHALSAARHQTPVRLFLHRAYGPHHLRLRARRTDREFRRAAAHGAALADQVGDLLRRRRYLAGQGHAEDRRHGRADHDQSADRLGPRDRRRGHRRPAAARHLHQRVPHGQRHLGEASRCWRSRSCSGCSSPSARCSCN